jgi:hypothetical protein
MGAIDVAVAPLHAKAAAGELGRDHERGRQFDRRDLREVAAGRLVVLPIAREGPRLGGDAVGVERREAGAGQQLDSVLVGCVVSEKKARTF